MTDYNVRLPSKREQANQPNITQFAYYLILVASICLIVLGLRHINDLDSYGTRWGTYSLSMGIMGLVGLIYQTNLNQEVKQLYPRKFKEFKAESIAWAFALFVGSIGIQIGLSQIQYDISSVEQTAYKIFSAPVEESFFRGFIMAAILNNVEDIRSKALRAFSISTSIIANSLVFMAFHVNYYGDPIKMLGVFLGGVLFSLAYLLSDDITIPILGHFFLNVLIYILSLGVFTYA